MSDEAETEDSFSEDGNNFNRNSQENPGFPDEEYDDDRDEFRFRNKRMRGGFRGRGYGPGGPPNRFRGPPPPNWGRGGRGARFGGPGWREDWDRPNWGPMGPPPGYNGPPGMMGPPGMPPPMMGGPPGPGGPGPMGMGPPGPYGPGPMGCPSNMMPPSIDMSGEIWVETKSPEGKPYYYHARTRETTWTKPEGPTVKILTQEQVEQMAASAMSAPMGQMGPGGPMGPMGGPMGPMGPGPVNQAPGAMPQGTDPAASQTDYQGAPPNLRTNGSASVPGSGSAEGTPEDVPGEVANEDESSRSPTSNSAAASTARAASLASATTVSAPMMRAPPMVSGYPAPTAGAPGYGMPPPGYQGPPGYGPYPGMPWGMPQGMGMPQQGQMQGAPGTMQMPQNAMQQPGMMNSAVTTSAPASKLEDLTQIDPQILARAAEWSEHKAPDGRPYYYNAKAGESVWEKPQALRDLESNESDKTVSIDRA